MHLMAIYPALAVSEIAQEMQRKADLGEEAELTQVSAASRSRIPSRDLTPPKYNPAARPSAV